MKETLRVYLILRFLTAFAFSLEGTTYTLFLKTHGLTDFQMNLMNVVCWLAMFFFQVPTGLMADVFGRKLSYLISCLFIVTGGVVYGHSQTMIGFSIAEILLALGIAFSSGAFDAWVIARLKEQGYSGAQSYISSRSTFVAYIGMIIGGSLGGFIGDGDLKYPWYAMAGVMGVTGVYGLLLMKETRGFDTRRGLEQWQRLKDTFCSSLRYLKKATELHFVIVLDAVVAFAIQPLNMYWQKVFHSMLPDIWMLGPIKSGISLTCMIGAYLVMRFGVGKNPKRSMLTLVFATGIFTIICCFLSSTLVLLLPFMLQQFTRGCYDPLENAYRQEHLPDAERATIASMISMIIAFTGALGLFVSGLIAEYVSIPAAWFVSGCCFIFVALYYLRKVKK